MIVYICMYVGMYVYIYIYIYIMYRINKEMTLNLQVAIVLLLVSTAHADFLT